MTGEHGIYVATLLGVDVICEPGTALGVEPVSEEAAECVRIEAGRPRLGLDMDADTMPQEAGINERAVSFTKGCYVGQETVARLHYRGKPNRHLRGLRLSEPAERGTEITLRRQGRRAARLHLRLPQARPDRAGARAPRGRAGRGSGCRRRARRGRATTVPASLNRADPRAGTGSRPTARCSATARRAPRATTTRPACSTCRLRRGGRSRSTSASCAASSRPPSPAARSTTGAARSASSTSSSRCSTSTTGTGSAWRSRGSRTCRPRAAR